MSWNWFRTASLNQTVLSLRNTIQKNKPARSYQDFPWQRICPHLLLVGFSWVLFCRLWWNWINFVWYLNYLFSVFVTWILLMYLKFCQQRVTERWGEEGRGRIQRCMIGSWWAGLNMWEARLRVAVNQTSPEARHTAHRQTDGKRGAKMVLNWNTQRLTAHCKHGKITHSVSNSSLQHMGCVWVCLCVCGLEQSLCSAQINL